MSGTFPPLKQLFIGLVLGVTICLFRETGPLNLSLQMMRVLIIIYTTWTPQKDPWRGSFLVLESEFCESSENWCVLITPSVDQVSNEYHSSQGLLGSSRPNWWLTLRTDGIHFMNWPHSWIQFISSPGSPFALLFFFQPTSNLHYLHSDCHYL